MSRPTPLRLESLNQLDGGIVARAFDRELAGVVQDCIDRPADNRPARWRSSSPSSPAWI